MKRLTRSNIFGRVFEHCNIIVLKVGNYILRNIYIALPKNIQTDAVIYCTESHGDKHLEYQTFCIISETYVDHGITQN